MGVFVSAGPVGLEGVFFFVEQATVTKAKPNSTADKFNEAFFLPMLTPKLILPD